MTSFDHMNHNQRSITTSEQAHLEIPLLDLLPSNWPNKAGIPSRAPEAGFLRNGIGKATLPKQEDRITTLALV